MPLPSLSHLQFAIIEAMGAKDRPGRDIRERLAKDQKIKKSLAAFYTVMKRMEDAGLIEGRYELVEIDGYRAKERHYKVLGKGFRAFEATRDWYSNSELVAVRSNVSLRGIL